MRDDKREEVNLITAGDMALWQVEGGCLGIILFVIICWLRSCGVFGN